MLYKQLIELFDILDSASASGAQVVEYFRSIVPDCQVETYPLEGPKGHTDMVRILIPGRNGQRRLCKDHGHLRPSGRPGSKTGAAGLRF
mgnify:CR=1 FL=1